MRSVHAWLQIEPDTEALECTEGQECMQPAEEASTYTWMGLVLLLLSLIHTLVSVLLVVSFGALKVGLILIGRSSSRAHALPLL